MPNFAYFDQIEQKINFLLTDKKYREAFNLCKDSIVKYPEEKRFLKIKSKIEEAVTEENEKIIKDKLEQLKPFWKEEKYVEILKTLKELLLVSPNDSKLKSLYAEAEAAYRKQFEKLKEEFIKNQTTRLNKLLDESPNQLMDELFMLERENPMNPDVKKLSAIFRDKLVVKKIKEKSQLLESDKYDILFNFIDELRKIDQLNPHITELENKIKSRKLGTAMTQTKEFVYGGEKHLDTLMKLKKYDKAIQAAEEILHVDKTSLLAQKVLQKALKKYAAQVRSLAADSIIKNYPNLKAEYLQDKTKFIKL